MISKLYSSKFLERLFHTLGYCLQKELEGCESVLDLGCGPSSPLQHCRGVKYSVGVEPFGPYLEESKKLGIHSEYLDKRIEDLDFPEGSFDAVLMIEVLEHLPKEVGLDVLKKCQRWAKKKVIISSPNGFLAQKELDHNSLQKHLSGWDYRAMRGRGFKCRGLAGLKFLRQENQEETMGDNLLSSIRFRPRFFWFVVATLSQLLTYYLPQLAFGLFSVKEVGA